MKRLIPSIVVLTAAPLLAQSLIGDAYQIDGSFDGAVFGPLSETVSTTGSVEMFTAGFDSGYLSWADEDSFDIEVLFPNYSYDLIVTLSDLNFTNSSGQPLAIQSASFNYSDSVYDGFFASPSNPTGAPRPSDPIVTFTANSVTVQYGSDWSSQLAADAPTMRFDITAVPEPATTLLLIAGLSVMNLRRKR